MQYKLGKKPARPGAIKLKLSRYLDAPKLPTPPAEFGHEALISDWLMLKNDVVGDCAIAGSLHETMLWNAEASRAVNIDDDCAIANYSAVTGYDPSQDVTGDDGSVSNPTDQGTDVAELAAYRLKTGLVDADGHRHRVGAYVALTPGDLTELWLAAYLFDGVGVGVQFPQQWMDAFSNGQPWDALADPDVEGGHYVTGVAKRDGNLVVVSWGQTVQLTPAGYQQFCDEAVAYVSQEKLANGIDLEGLNWAQLVADLQTLNTGGQLQ